MPDEERAQDQLAQLELLVHDRVHLLHGDPQDPAGCADDRSQVGALAGEQTDLAHKFPRPVGHDHEFVWLSIVLNDPGLAFEQDDEVIRLIAVAEDHVADRDALFRPLATKALELRPAQPRPTTWEPRRSPRTGA